MKTPTGKLRWFQKEGSEPIPGHKNLGKVIYEKILQQEWQETEPVPFYEKEAMYIIYALNNIALKKVGDPWWEDVPIESEG